MNNAIISRQKCIEKLQRGLTKVGEVLRSFKKIYLKNTEENNLYVEYIEVDGYSPIEIDESIEHSIHVINAIFIDMSRLRDMTIYIIEQIHEWKLKVEEWSDKCRQPAPVSYIYNGEDFYLTLQQDLKFLWDSSLSEYIFFKDKYDPLLIRNVVEVESK